MKPLVRIVAAGCCLHLALAGVRAGSDPTEAPGTESLLQAVRAVTPSFVGVSYLEKKGWSGSGDRWEFEGSLNGTILDNLYVDISQETLGPPPAVGADSATPTRPVILRKTRARREILDIPVKLQLTRSEGRWTVSRMESEPPLAALGSPSSKYPLNALVYGTPQATAAIHAYQSALASPKPAAKKEPVTPETPAPEKPAKVVEKPPEAAKKAEEPPVDKKQCLAQLLAACTSGTLYEGTLREHDGLHEVILDFGRVERDGDFVTADLREKHSSFQRRELSGQVRANPKIPQNYELVLVGMDSPTSRTSSKKTSQTALYRVAFVLTLDEDKNMVGNYESKATYTGQTSSLTLPSPLTSNAVYQIRFSRSSSRF